MIPDRPLLVLISIFLYVAGSLVPRATAAFHGPADRLPESPGIALTVAEGSVFDGLGETRTVYVPTAAVVQDALNNFDQIHFGPGKNDMIYTAYRFIDICLYCHRST